MKKIILACVLLFFSCFFSSCASRAYFVVLRGVPANPSITVIPANENLTEVEFATTVESYVLAARVRVLQRPGAKDGQPSKNISQAENRAAREPVTEQVTTERYFPLANAKSDYLLFTYATNRQIKLVKKTTGEVLSSVTLAGALGKDQQSESETVYQNLRSAGLLARKKK